MRRNRDGSTLVFAVSLVGLLSLMAVLLCTPRNVERRQLEWHYRNVQAQYLSLAGVERARAWASTGVVTNEVYELGEGNVLLVMKPGAGKTCHVKSTGRVDRPGQTKP